MSRIFDPHYPHIVLGFTYRGCRVEIDRTDLSAGDSGETPMRSSLPEISYAAWVHYDRGCVIAVNAAPTSNVAIRCAKAWVDRYHELSPS